MAKKREMVKDNELLAILSILSLIFAVCALGSLPSAHAFGLATPYLENNTLKLERSQAYTYTFTVQNPDDASFDIVLDITDPDRISRLRERNLSIPPKSFDNQFVLDIVVPTDAIPGDRYEIGVVARPDVLGGGQISMSVQLGATIHILVVDAQGMGAQETWTGKVARSAGDAKKTIGAWASAIPRPIVIGGVVIIVIAVIVLLVWRFWGISWSISVGSISGIQSLLTHLRRRSAPQRPATPISQAPDIQCLTHIVQGMPERFFKDHRIKRLIEDRYRELGDAHMASRIERAHNKKDARPRMHLAALVLICSALLVMAYATPTQAADFDISVSVCAPDWYCTNYTEGACGTRTCIDSHNCGMPATSPALSLSCPSSGGGGSGRNRENNWTLVSNATNASINQTASPPQPIESTERQDEERFSLLNDLLRVQLTKGKVEERTIVITSPRDDTFTIESDMPGTPADAITVTPTSISIPAGASKTVTLRIDSSLLDVGAYGGRIHVSAGDETQDVRLFVLVKPAVVSIPMRIEMEEVIDVKDDRVSVAIVFLNAIDTPVDLTYQLIDSQGKVHELGLARQVDTGRGKHTTTLGIPSDLSTGTYALAVLAKAGSSLMDSEVRLISLLDRFLYHPANTEQPTVPTQASPPLGWVFPMLTILCVLTLIGVFAIRAHDHRRMTRNPGARVDEPEAQGDHATKKEYQDRKALSGKELELLKEAFTQGYLTKEELERFVKPDTTTDSRALEQESRHPLPTSTAPVEPPAQKTAAFVLEESPLFRLVAPPEKAFVTKDGERFASIRDLYHALLEMSKATFRHHTEEGRNDFANWIGDVFDERGLAIKVKAAETARELRTALEQAAKSGGRS